MNKQFFKVDFLLPYLFGPIRDIYRKLSEVHTDGKRYPLALELLKSKKVVALLNQITELSQVNKKFRNSIRNKITSNKHYELYLWMIYLSTFYLDMWKILYDNKITDKSYHVKFNYDHRRLIGYTFKREIKMLRNDIDYVVLEVRIIRNDKLVNHYSLWYNNKKGEQIATDNTTKIDKWPSNYNSDSWSICPYLLLYRQLSKYLLDKRERDTMGSFIHKSNSLNHVIEMLYRFIYLLELS